MTEEVRNLNFYELIPEVYKKPLATYPNHKRIQIDLPVRMVIAGSSGTGKTQAVMNIVDQFDCFNRFYLFIADVNEPLYKFLCDFVTKRFGKKAIIVFDSIAEMPDVKSFDPRFNNLIIIDDMINEKSKDHKNAIDVYTKGRRQNCSIIYLTQDFFKTNLTIRKNSKIIIMTRFDDAQDLDNILKKYKGSMSMQHIKRLYEYATADGKEDFFCIDTEGKPSMRYRKNLNPIGK